MHSEMSLDVTLTVFMIFSLPFSFMAYDIYIRIMALMKVILDVVVARK